MCTNLMRRPSTPQARAPEEVAAAGSQWLALPPCLLTLSGDGQASGSLVALLTVVRKRTIREGQKQLNALEALHCPVDAEALMTRTPQLKEHLSRHQKVVKGRLKQLGWVQIAAAN